VKRSDLSRNQPTGSGGRGGDVGHGSKGRGSSKGHGRNDRGSGKGSGQRHVPLKSTHEDVPGVENSWMQVDHPNTFPKRKKGNRRDRSFSSSSNIDKPSAKNQKSGPTSENHNLSDNSSKSGTISSDGKDANWHIAALNANLLKRQEGDATKQRDAVLNRCHRVHECTNSYVGRTSEHSTRKAEK